MPQDAPPNGSAPGPAPPGPWSRVAGMQAKLHRWAAADPGRRFDDLSNFVCDPATLIVAFDRVAGNRGANTPGVDGWTVALVEERIGVPGYLDDLRAALKDGSFRPLPVRERKIPKPGGSGNCGNWASPPWPTRWSRPRSSSCWNRSSRRTSSRSRMVSGRCGGRTTRSLRSTGSAPAATGGCSTRTSRRPLTTARRHGTGAGQDQGQARARAGQGVPQGRGPHRSRRLRGHPYRHPAGRDLVPVDLQRRDVGAR